MFGLSSSSSYAVLALSSLAGEGENWILARDLAAAIEAPLPYLSKILHGLSGAGIVEAKRGYRGGFRLLRRADQLTVGEIVIAVEGPDFLEGCLLGKAECSDRRACPAHAFWGLERERIRSQLQRLTLADVARFERAAGRGLKPAGRSRPKPAASGARRR
jgi:Rrf2 family protein